VLKRCVEEDRILITENARDFRGLIGRIDIHPGLVILPSISRAGTLRLVEAVLRFLGEQPDPRNYMLNRVLEVGEDGAIAEYKLPD